MPEFHSIINPVDVTGPLSDIISFLLQAFKFCFDFLKSIEFAGTNLLSICLTVALISMIFPIVFSVVRTGSTIAIREAGKEINRKKQSEKESSKK